MRNPRCTVNDKGDEFGYRCGTPEDHEGYEHAEDITDIEFALEDERVGDGQQVFDCDGDVVLSVESPNDDGVVGYAFGSSRVVSHSHVNFILIPEIEAADPEEVAAAIASIRNTTI